MQSLIVTLVVTAAFAYSAWTLMPTAWRRTLARRMLPWWGERAPLGLRRAAQSGGGCGGCDGCGDTPKRAGPAAPQPITLHRRAPR